MVAKQELLVDVDDVIVEHVRGFVAWNNKQEWAHSSQITFEEYSENWAELWGIDPESVEDRKKQFFVPEVIGTFDHIVDAETAIPKLSTIRRLCAVTSRRESLQEVTEQTLESLVPGAFSEVVCATYFKGGKKFTRNKPTICEERGAEGLIDDQLKTCVGIAGIGRVALLFGDYPWNQSPGALPGNVVRVENWRSVLEYYGLENNGQS